MLLSEPLASLILRFSGDEFNKILSQQLRVSDDSFYHIT